MHSACSIGTGGGSRTVSVRPSPGERTTQSASLGGRAQQIAGPSSAQASQWTSSWCEKTSCSPPSGSSSGRSEQWQEQHADGDSVVSWQSCAPVPSRATNDCWQSDTQPSHGTWAQSTVSIASRVPRRVMFSLATSGQRHRIVAIVPRRRGRAALSVDLTSHSHHGRELRPGCMGSVNSPRLNTHSTMHP